ncbi:Protein of unknown function [Lactobacillus delbrueckii subsp. lactis]|nr:Protein of unknown function [Lactobacillus delbrueckii subsp. lactis]
MLVGPVKGSALACLGLGQLPLQ